MSSGRSTSYSPNVQKPTGKSPRVKRTLLMLLLLPPVGLYYMWQNGVFRTRGRLILTVISTLEMTFILSFFIKPATETVGIAPVPVAPPYVTMAPEEDVSTALSSIDAILAQQQAESGEFAEDEEDDVDRAVIAAEEAERQAVIRDTIVYSVYGSSAKYYHANTVCGTQSNRRQLTVLEAMQEGLGACPNCNPPIYTGN